MSAASPYDLPFDIPEGLSPLDDATLQQTSLVRFYKENQADFLDVMTVRYFEVKEDPDSGALADRKKWFDSFCDLMTAFFLAPPSQTLFTARDEHGNHINFFGKAIMQHLGDIPAQQLYAYDGNEKHGMAWLLVRAFVRYVVIDCFRRRSVWLREEVDIFKARSRIQELREGKRTLKLVPPTGHVFFGKQKGS